MFGLKSRRNSQNNLSRQFLTFVLLFVGIAGVVFLRVIWVLKSVKEESAAAGIDTSALVSTIWLTIIAGIALLLSAMAMSTLLSQRIFAPMIPIRRLISRLRDGDYSARGSLRKGDEFKDLMADLNSLAETLESKYGVTPAEPPPPPPRT